MIEGGWWLKGMWLMAKEAGRWLLNVGCLGGVSLTHHRFRGRASLTQKKLKKTTSRFTTFKHGTWELSVCSNIFYRSDTSRFPPLLISVIFLTTIGTNNSACSNPQERIPVDIIDIYIFTILERLIRLENCALVRLIIGLTWMIITSYFISKKYLIP